LGGEVPIPLVPGWNLVSTPLTPTSIIPMAAQWDRSGMTFWGWDPENGYMPYDTMIPGRGYWFYSSVSGILFILGMPPATTDVTAEPGWNFVGPIETIPDLDTSGLGSVFGWDPDQQAYTTGVTALEILNGYWVFVSPGSAPVTLQSAAGRR